MANPTESSKLGYLDVNILRNGEVHAEIDYTRTEVEYLRTPALGSAIIRPKQFGSCTSEIPYYMGGKDDKPSRFLQDSTNEAKQLAYLLRTMQEGYTSDPEELQDIMVHSPFHEGYGIIEEVNPDFSASEVPVLMYVPINENGVVRLERRIVPMNFQTGFEPGSLASLNPAILCKFHSSATNLDKDTGWPQQCNRETHDGHLPKATRGHTEALGTAVEGKRPVTLDSLTPLPPKLQEYILQDQKKRGILATSIEPLACVYQAHGLLLQNGEVPKSIAIIGDGPNSLLMMMFYQVYAPDAEIVIVGKNKEKLEVIQQVNPQKIRTVATEGTSSSEGYANLSYALKQSTGSQQADIVIPTVALPESTVSPFVKDKGMLIWWAAAISEDASKGRPKRGEGRYRQFHSYGGAPRAEFSAAAGMDYLVQHNPAALAPLTEYPGIFYTDMGEQAATSVESWLNGRGRFIHPDNGLSAKIVVNME